MYLTLDKLTKSYGDTLVLDQVSCTVGSGDRVGLVGANGAGKSTLLKIVTGSVEADSGRVRLGEGAEIGYLPQTFEEVGDVTVAELLDEAMGSLTDLEAQMRELEARLASSDDTASDDDVSSNDDVASDAGPAALQAYGRVQEKFERLGGYERDARIEQVLAGLGVAYVPRSAQVGRLSGGEQARLGLAALLLRRPDLLLLDEPTNHLDFRAIEWLEGYLSGFGGGVLVVSHDRQFLNRVVGSILEIDEHSRSMKRYAGSYDFYAERKTQERIRWQNDYERQHEEVRELRRAIKGSARQVAHNRPPKDGDKYIKNFKAARIEGVISRNVRSVEAKLRRIEADPIPRPPRELRFDADFDPNELVSHSPLTVSELTKRYDERAVLNDVSFAISGATRAAIVGPNGAGKSTMLKVIAGLVEQDAGDVDIAGSVRLGYLDQQQETLPHGVSVYEAFRGDREGGWEAIKSELLAYGLFVYEELGKQVDDLSVGQKRKLQIARLMADRANVLLLDEPTNHISLDVLEQFEEALLAFPGPVIAVSHDRRFLDRFANEIWELREGTLHRYLVSWEGYREEHRETVLAL